MKRILKILPEIILLLFLIITVSMVGEQRKLSGFSKFKIDIEKNDQYVFIDANDVESIIGKKYENIKTLKLAQINVNTLEKMVEKHPSVKSCQVFTDVNGGLHVRVKQRTPIVRLVNKQGDSFYLDEEGYVMPLSRKYNARVLVVNGEFSTPFKNHLDVKEKDSLQNEYRILNDIYNVAKEIHADAFLNALLEQIYVDEAGEMILTPKIGPKEILFGKGENAGYKLQKLTYFYKEGYPLKGFDAYKKLNVKFSDQVVATRIN